MGIAEMVLKLLMLISGTVMGYRAFRGQVEVSRSSEDGQEVWGYSQVAPGSHMFWWLSYSTHPEGRYTRPLVIWLQGGPGLSSCGLGNLGLLGPLDENMEPRNHTWKLPVYIFGQSYGGKMAAAFGYELKKKLPVYIFGQSYGGKMAAAFGYELKKAIITNDTDINFKGVALGNAWISPADTALNMAPLMLHMSVIDSHQYEKADAAARTLAKEIESSGGQCPSCQEKWYEAMDTMPVDVSVYNLRNYLPTPEYSSSRIIPKRMNGMIRQKLGIIPDHVEWEELPVLVGSTAMKNDFFASETDKVDWLLDRGIEVVVYQTQLDIICPTNGAQDWINKLKWKHSQTFYNTTRVLLKAPGEKTPEMFVKAYENLKFYVVLDAGHAVPYDTPAAALRMLGYILKNEHTGAALY